MKLSKMTAGIETATEATGAEYASALRNRDVLTLLSENDRARLAGQFAVVVRNGASAGKVIGCGQTREDAVLMAESQADYVRINCAVQYVCPCPEQDVDLNTGSKY